MRQMRDLEERACVAVTSRPVRRRSRKEGARCASRPRGRHTMMPTIAAPKISMRNSAKARPNSGSVTSTIAASTTPNLAAHAAEHDDREDRSPILVKVKLSGLMKP